MVLPKWDSKHGSAEEAIVDAALLLSTDLTDRIKKTVLLGYHAAAAYGHWPRLPKHPNTDMYGVLAPYHAMLEKASSELQGNFDHYGLSYTLFCRDQDVAMIHKQS